MKSKISKAIFKKEISTERNKRTVNCTDIYISYDKVDCKIVNALFYKSLMGYILIALNCKNKPVKSWMNISCVSILNNRVVEKEKFKHIIESLNPKILYINDGELLRPLKHKNIVYLEQGKQLKTILSEIEIFITPTSSEDRDNIPTYKSMLALDPQLTKKQYNKFVDEIKLIQFYKTK